MAIGAFIGLGSSVAQAGLGAFSSIMGGRSQKDAADFNAAVARNDSIAQQQKLKFKLDRLRSRRARVLGAQEASAAGRGIVGTTGSAAAIAIDTDVQSDLDIAAARFGARRRIGALQTKAANLRIQGLNARRAGIFGAAGSILGAVPGIAQRLDTIFNEDE